MNVETGTVSSTANVTGTDSSHPGYVLTAVKKIATGSSLATLEGGVVKKNNATVGSFSARDNGGVLEINTMGIPKTEYTTVTGLVYALVDAVQPS